MSGFWIVELLGGLLDELAVVVQLTEVIRCQFVVNGRCGTRIDIETDTEVSERALDKFVITVNHLLSGNTFFTCANGDRHSVFVATAYVQHFLPLQTQVSCIDVSGNIYASQVTDMHRTVGVRQCRCDKCAFVIHILLCVS